MRPPVCRFVSPPARIGKSVGEAVGFPTGDGNTIPYSPETQDLLRPDRGPTDSFPHRHFTLRTIRDAAFREKLDIHLARSGSIHKKAKDCHVRTEKKILNERK